MLSVPSDASPRRRVADPAPPVAALYVRVSSRGQEEEGTSLETQEARCRAYATAQGYTVDEAHVYREVYTGVELWERRELTRLREAVRHREVRAVVAYAIDRLARDPVHLGVILSEAEHAGVAVLFVSEPLDDSPEGQLIRYVRGYAAKVEHEKIKERTWRGKLARVDAGHLLPGARAPYGYAWADERKTQLLIDATTAVIVRRIFAWCAEGCSLRAIAGRLTGEQVPTPTGRRGPWSYQTIRWILLHPIYAGQPVALRHQGKKTPGGRRRAAPRPEAEHRALPPDGYPAIVESVIVLAARERLIHNKAQAPRNNQHPEATLLRGGFVRCAHCGCAMAAERRGQYFVYVCDTARRRSARCVRHSISATVLDAAVWERVERVLTDPAIIAAELKRLQQDDPTEADLAAVERSLAEVGRKQQKAARNIVLLEDEEAAAPLRAELTALSERRCGLEHEREGILARRAGWAAARHRLTDLAAWCQTLAARVAGLDYAAQRLALDALAVEVQVSPREETPRYVITARVPLGTDGIVSRTSSCSSTRRPTPLAERWRPPTSVGVPASSTGSTRSSSASA